VKDLMSKKELINGQHLGLDELLKQLDKMQPIFDTSMNEEAYDLFDDLVRYLNVHFRTEEQFMRSQSIERLDEHTRAHDKILEDIKTVIAQYNKKPSQRTFRDATQRIIPLLKNHIKDYDKDYEHLMN
jgi:hemerythrin-like metal-binding protein